jgi:hypothetical protein
MTPDGVVTSELKIVVDLEVRTRNFMSGSAAAGEPEGLYSTIPIPSDGGLRQQGGLNVHI